MVQQMIEAGRLVVNPDNTVSLAEDKHNQLAD